MTYTSLSHDLTLVRYHPMSITNPSMVLLLWKKLISSPTWASSGTEAHAKVVELAAREYQC
jgi:hypothetical protein